MTLAHLMGVDPSGQKYFPSQQESARMGQL
jgi:hypothetical protein